MKFSSIRQASIAAVLFLLVSHGALGQTGTDAKPDYTFTGTYTSADWGAYRYIPFQVPAGITAIKVNYSFSANDGKPARLEIGLFDPNGYRGYSLDGKSEFVVAESLAATTDCFLAGRLPAGEWRVLLGIPSVNMATAFAARLIGEKVPSRNSVVSYKVEIKFSRAPNGDPFVMPARKYVVISDQPGWYYGDLHAHSTHSDGDHSLEQVLQYAHDQGLDFFGTAEHNVISHYQYLGELQKKFPDMLILSSSELTTYQGHANVYNLPGIYNFRSTEPGYDINAEIDRIHAGGGYFSPNHPMSFLGIGLPFEIKDIDRDKVDFYEVVNGKVKLWAGMPNPINLKAIHNWDRMVRQGHHITAIGGSDDHKAGQDQSLIGSKIGWPTTVVYARQLSTDGILSAMKAGHVYVLTRNGPKSGMKIEFGAEGGGKTVMMGDRINADKIKFKVTVDGAKCKTLVVFHNGFPFLVPITSDHFQFSFSYRPSNDGYVRLEVRSGPFPEIVTNPIYYGP